jgi:2-hydroxy-3-oxopropionate reductase
MTFTIGWIGAGVMGRPMAANLLHAGYDVLVVERASAGVTELVALGARTAPGPRSLAERADVVLTMLPDTGAVRDVVLGENGVAGGLRPGSLFIDMSSIAPATARHSARELSARGSDAVDAPVSGGQEGAREATLSIMAGGTPAAFARALPIFRHLGTSSVHVGPAGSGQVAKACNQLAVAVTIEAAAEALALAEAAGCDARNVLAALSGGLAASRVLERYGPRMLESRYEPGARARLHLKDLTIAGDLAADAGVVLPALDLLKERFRELVALGPDLDHSALRLLLAQQPAHSGSTTP